MNIIFRREDLEDLEVCLSDRRNVLRLKTGELTMCLSPGQAYKLFTAMKPLLMRINAKDFYQEAPHENELRAALAAMQKGGAEE